MSEKIYAVGLETVRRKVNHLLGVTLKSLQVHSLNISDNNFELPGNNYLSKARRLPFYSVIPFNVIT